MCQGLTTLSFLSPQVTPQGGAGTLPLSQASSSLSTTGKGQAEREMGWGARVTKLGTHCMGHSLRFSSSSGPPWPSKLSLGWWGTDRAAGRPLISSTRATSSQHHGSVKKCGGCQKGTHLSLCPWCVLCICPVSLGICFSSLSFWFCMITNSV